MFFFVTNLKKLRMKTCCFFLYSLSSSGRVIIMSIHQPRYSIYKLFDSLTLISRGRMVYHGPTSNALNYFNEIGKMLINCCMPLC